LSTMSTLLVLVAAVGLHAAAASRAASVKAARAGDLLSMRALA
jgi:hypothetical protein